MATHADREMAEDPRAHLIDCYVVLRDLAAGADVASDEIRSSARRLAPQILALAVGLAKI